MKKYFGDSSIVIHFIQQIFNETFNDAVYVNGDYYKNFDMNYGFAHYIAKYLDYMYPILDDNTIEEYKHIPPQSENYHRPITEPISISNYFLCSNNGTRLQYNSFPYSDPNVEYIKSPIYDDIYNRFMRIIEKIVVDSNGHVLGKYCGPDGPIGTTFYEYDKELEQFVIISPEDAPYAKYIDKNDLPIFTKHDDNSGAYSINTNTIFTLDKWDTKKDICEIDDLVASFLLGRVIGPNSSMEDIYYAQKLLIRNRDIKPFEKGIWCPDGRKGTMFDMTQTVMNYQKQFASSHNTKNIFITGYFDIFTESCILKEIGEGSYGILGL